MYTDTGLNPNEEERRLPTNETQNVTALQNAQRLKVHEN